MADRSVGSHVWELLAKLAPRLNPHDSKELVALAASHPWWSRFTTEHRTLYEVAAECIVALPASARKRLVVRILHNLRQDTKQLDDDYAVRLAAYLASNLNEGFARLMGDRLYRKGETISAALIQTAESFGMKVAMTPTVQNWLPRVIEGIQQQVQWIDSSGEPNPVPETVMTYTKSFPNGRKLIVSCVGTISLHAVVGFCGELERSSVEAFADAVLVAVEQPDNIIANRCALVDVIRDAPDIFINFRARQAFNVLVRLALGEFQEPEHIMSSAEANNPLNPYKMRSGDPSLLRAKALQTLGRFESMRPDGFGRSLRDTLWQGLNSSDKKVQLSACDAWSGITKVPRAVQLHLLLATRGAVPDITATAFGVIGSNSAIQPRGAEWNILIGSLEAATCSEHNQIRRNAAAAAYRLLDRFPPATVQTQLEQLQSSYQKDICWSVRQQASQD